MVAISISVTYMTSLIFLGELPPISNLFSAFGGKDFGTGKPKRIILKLELPDSTQPPKIYLPKRSDYARKIALAKYG